MRENIIDRLHRGGELGTIREYAFNGSNCPFLEMLDPENLEFLQLLRRERPSLPELADSTLDELIRRLTTRIRWQQDQLDWILEDLLVGSLLTSENPYRRMNRTLENWLLEILKEEIDNLTEVIAEVMLQPSLPRDIEMRITFNANTESFTVR